MRTNHAERLRAVITTRTVSRRALLAGAAAGAAAGVASTHAAAQTSALDRKPPADHVILVDWDGFDPEFLGRSGHPAVDALAARGAQGLATNTLLDVLQLLPVVHVHRGHPEVHRNTGYYYDVAADRAISQERVLEAETIAEALGRQGRNVASVQWYMLQDHGTAYGDPMHLYVQPGGSFSTTSRVAIDILHRRRVSSGGRQVTAP